MSDTPIYDQTCDALLIDDPLAELHTFPPIPAPRQPARPADADGRHALAFLEHDPFRPPTGAAR